MKAVLIFNLPEDDVEYKLASRATDFVCVLSELDSALRSAVKYGTKPDNSGGTLTAEEQEMCASIRQLMFCLMEDHSVTLEGL